MNSPHTMNWLVAPADPATAMADVEARRAMLERWLSGRLPADARAWLAGRVCAIRRGERDGLALALSMAARKTGKQPMRLGGADLSEAARLRPGFDPARWRVDQAARVALVLAAYDGDPLRFARQVGELAQTAEINEAVALYLGIALYPAAPELERHAREAVRSAMRPLFEAIAHDSPFPMERFDTAAWNQMVVKTFFLESPLWPVQGIEARANPALSAMLVDLAHERWAAGRPVNPECWRCVAPYADGAGMAAMQRVLERGEDGERLAVALALRQLDSADARRLRRACGRQGLDQRAAACSWATLSAYSR